MTNMDGTARTLLSQYNVTRVYAANGLNQYTAAGPASFAYDLNGNLTGDGTTTYAYDAENRLVSAATATGTTTLSYDPLGRLWQVVRGTAATRFLYDGDDLIQERDGSGALLRAYVHAPGAGDEPLMWYEYDGGFSRRFLHADHQGSIVAVTGSNGAPIATTGYDSWGIPDEIAPNVPKLGFGEGRLGRFGYTGQAWIPELGLYYYKARIYSPTLGRFLQTDPVGYDDQMNLYAYVGNDPVNRTDPTGRRIKLTGEEEQRSRFRNLAYRLTGIRLRETRSGHLRQVGTRNSRVGNAGAARTLTHALNSRSTINIAAVSRDDANIGDNFSTGIFDMHDFELFEDRSTLFAGALLSHVLAERLAAAERGLGYNSGAHTAGLREENRVMGTEFRAASVRYGNVLFSYYDSERGFIDYAFPRNQLDPAR